MRRILVIGNSGGGKSTLARRLGEKLGLPVVHLDVLFWKPGWEESDKDDFKARLSAQLDQGDWVCDGNFSSSFDASMARADTIVWIDQSPLLCLARAIWRIVVYRRGDRPDMAEGCDESIDLKFYGYILGFRRNYHPLIEAGLAAHGAHARLIRLKNDREIDAFVAQA